MLRILLLHAAYLGTGLIILNLLPRARAYPRSLKWCLGYFTGVFVHVLVLLGCLVLKITAQSVPWLLMWGGLLALTYSLWREVGTSSGQEATEGASTSGWVPRALAFALITPPLWLITVQLVGVPEVSYDSTAFWNLKAKYFFFGEHLWGDAFQNPIRVDPHPNYPLYRPIFAYEHYAILGSADDFASKPGFWIFNMIGLLLLGALVKRWAGGLVAVMAAGILLYTPLCSFRAVPGSIATTYADFPLSIMIAGSVGFLFNSLRWRDPLDMAGAMVCVSSAVLLKQEGMVWLVIFVLVGFAAISWSRTSLVHKDHLWFLIPLAVLSMWLWIRSHLPPGSDLASPSLDQINMLPSALVKVGESWARRVSDVRLWAWTPFLLAIGFFIGLARNVRTAYGTVPIMLVMMIGSSFLVTLLLEVQIGYLEAFQSYLYDRLILQVVPAVLLSAVVLNSIAIDSDGEH